MQVIIKREEAIANIVISLVVQLPHSIPLLQHEQTKQRLA